MENTTHIESELNCPFTSRLQEALETPVENCRKIHRQKLASLLFSLQEEMDLAVLKIKLSEQVLQRKILIKLKSEMTQKLDSVMMPEERRSYLLHQLSNVHSIDELASLIEAINLLQINQSSVIISLNQADELYQLLNNHRQDLMLIAQTKQGISLTKQTFSLIAGIFTDEVEGSSFNQLKAMAGQESILLLNHELKINETLMSSLNSVELKGKKLAHSIVAITGTTGNVMSLICDMIAGKVSKLILMHHSPIDFSMKLQRSLLAIIQEIVASPFDSHLTRTVKHFWQDGMVITEFLEIPEIKMVLTTSTDLNSLKQADIVLCGNCPTNGFITLDHFKPHSVVIDMTSTSAFESEMIKKMEMERSDLSYHMIFRPRKLVLN